jgi:hypothetical protein
MDPSFVGGARAMVYIFMRSTSKNKNYAEDVEQGKTIRYDDYYNIEYLNYIFGETFEQQIKNLHSYTPNDMWNLRRYLLDFVLEIYKNIQLYHLVY